MFPGKIPLLVLIVGLVNLLDTAECRDVPCYKCSWTGTQELDEEKEKDLEKARRELENKADPINNPLVSPFFMHPSMPDRLVLEQKCIPCQLPDGVCVRWTFHLDEIVQNATFMCAKNMETGIFSQDMPNGFEKKVIICNGDFCNASPGERLKPFGIVYVISVSFLCFLFNK